MEVWQYSVSIIVGVAGKQPKTPYAGLQKFLQKKRAFVQRFTPGIGTALHPVEDKLCDAFLQDLFKGATYHIPGRAVTGQPVKRDGIALLYPTQIAGSN